MKKIKDLQKILLSTDMILPVLPLAKVNVKIKGMKKIMPCKYLMPVNVMIDFFRRYYFRLLLLQ